MSRVTFVLPAWAAYPVGGFKIVYEYGNRLASLGYQIQIVHEKSRNQGGRVLSRWIGELSGRFRGVFGVNPTVPWFQFNQGVRILAVPSLEERYIPDGDAVIATSWRTAPWVNGYGADKGTKLYFVQSYETWDGPEDEVQATWRMPLGKIVIARWLADLAKEMDEDVLAYIPNGIDFDRFRFSVPIEARNSKAVGMLYHRHKLKGTDDGLEALRIVKRSVPDLEVVLFGIFERGPNIPEWMAYHRNPSSDALCGLYNSMSIFVNPSLIEGWPLPPAEAMACGCALVSTDIPGIREYAIHEQSALLSPPGDPSGLAKHIIQLIQNDERRLALAREGHRYIRQFTWDRSVSQFANVLKGLGLSPSA